MLYFEYESENKPAIEQYFASEFVPITHVQRRGFFLICLPSSSTKLKIIPNRKLAVLKDVIKDTNNSYEELM